MAKKVNNYGLKVTPEDVDKALIILQAYINERAALIDAGKIDDVPSGVKMMAAIQDFAEKVGKFAKAPAELLFNHIRFTTLPNLMDAADIPSLTVDGIGKCRLQDDISCKVNDAEGLKGWLTINGLEDIITETVNAQTLAAQMRARIKANAEEVDRAMRAGTTDPETLQKLQKPMPPEAIVKIMPVVRAQLTRE